MFSGGGFWAFLDENCSANHKIALADVGTTLWLIGIPWPHIEHFAPRFASLDG